MREHYGLIVPSGRDTKARQLLESANCRSSQQDAERARRRVYDGGLNPGRDNMEFDEGPGSYLFLGCGPELTCGASLSHSLDATQNKQKSPWS